MPTLIRTDPITLPCSLARAGKCLYEDLASDFRINNVNRESIVKIFLDQ